MSEQITINQHYIPQCVLKHFSNEKNQVIEALVDKKRMYIANYRNSMSERYTYEHPKLDKNRLERYFDRIENYFSIAIIDIIKKIEKYEQEQIEFKEVKMLIEKYMREFIIFYYRSGALLYEFSFMQEVKHHKINLLLQNIMNAQYIKQLSATIINYYDIAIIKSDDEKFLLSDQYISTASLKTKGRFSNISNRHFGLKDVVILIPLSSKYYIVYYEGNIPSYIHRNTLNSLNKMQIKSINKTIINNSYKKCIGYSEYAMKEALEEFETQSPAIAMAKYNSGVTSGATLKKEVFFYERDERAWNFFTTHKFIDYKDAKRNSLCPCGSEKKFKKCCLDLYEESMTIINNLQRIKSDNRIIYVNPNAKIEKSIAEFFFNN